MPDAVRVFISYSHDSEVHRERIRALATRLRGHGIDAWIDQFSPPPIEGWPRWAEQQFVQAQFVIVACTESYAERFNRPPGVGSGVGWEAVLIRQELYNRGGNTRFIPISFDDDDQAVPLVLQPYPRYSLPRDYEQLHQHLLGETKDVPPLGSPSTFEGVRSDAGAGAQIKLWHVPPRPAQYLPREELDALKVSLISSKTQTVAIAGEHHRLGIQGMPGVGKTVLAAALAADADVHEAFPGGVFWLTLGRTPDDVVVWQGNLAEALAGHRVEIRTVREGKAKLGELFAARPPSLLILDDVWKVADADPFDAPAAPSRLLITTRNQEVAKGLGATVREIKELSSAGALAMLAAYADRPIDALPKVAHDIVRECGELPLAVAMAGAMLQGRPEDQWPTLLEQLKNADLEHLTAALPEYRQHLSMLAAIEISVQELPEDVRLRYLDFAVFPEDVEVPERVLHRLWGAAGVKLFTAQQTVNVLVDRSLIRRVSRSRGRNDERHDDHPPPPPNDEEVCLTLHDLQHDYVRARGGELIPRHARLVDAYRSTSPGKALHAVEPDGYFFEHIARHVRDGDGPAALRALLFDHRWLQAKLNATGVNALLADFELLDLASDVPLRYLRDALRLSDHVLSQRPEELSSQLLGRLRDASEAELHHLCDGITANSNSPSLLPVRPCLRSPGERLRHTLEGHSRPVTAVAVSADGKVVVSGSDDGTLRVWDAETGRERRTLKGGAVEVRTVALSADGTTAVSDSGGGMVNVWDVEPGQQRVRLDCHTQRVSTVALSADGKVVVAGSDDGTLRVWDAETGQERRTLKGHVQWVSSVALSADGKIAVSSSRDRTLKVWDMETGQERRTLEGHTGRVTAVAVNADGKMAVSGSIDETVKMWDLETGQQTWTLKGHTDRVEAVAVGADGQTVVSGSNDGMLKVWDVETGQQTWALKGHFNWVSAVAVSGDGNTVVSGSGDRTVKVWDMKAGEHRRMLEGHADWVSAVAVSGDGKTAASGSHDRKLKVWDMETGQERRTLEGHADWVNIVAVSRDGKTVVSGSADRKLKVWDVEPGQVRRTHEVDAAVLSGDGKTAVSLSWAVFDRWDGRNLWTLKVWDVETGQQKWTLKHICQRVRQVALSADGEVVVFSSDDGTLAVYGASWLYRTLEGCAGKVTAVALSGDGKTAIAGFDDGTLTVWGAETAWGRRTLEGHISTVNWVALSENGKTAVSGSRDRTLRVWDAETGCCVASFTGEAAFTAVALSQTMRIFAGDSAGHVHLLELRLGPDRCRGPQS